MVQEIIKLANSFLKAAENNVFDDATKIRRQIEIIESTPLSDLKIKGKRVSEAQRFMILKSLKNRLEFLESLELEEMFYKPSKQEITNMLMQVIDDASSGLITLDEAKKVFDQYRLDNGIKSEEIESSMFENLDSDKIQIARMLLN